MTAGRDVTRDTLDQARTGWLAWGCGGYSGDAARLAGRSPVHGAEGRHQELVRMTSC
jgi:hypothetical protein